MRLPAPIKVVYPGPIDSRFSVDQYSGLETIANSGLAYAYMRVVNEADGYTYELQPDMRTWSLYTAKGPKGDTGPAISVGTVELLQGDPDLQITIDSNTGKLNFRLTLPY